MENCMEITQGAKNRVAIWFSKPKESHWKDSWIFIGKTIAEIEAPTLWILDAENWLIRKDSDTGKDWRQKEKGVAEDEMVR